MTTKFSLHKEYKMKKDEAHLYRWINFKDAFKALDKGYRFVQDKQGDTIRQSGLQIVLMKKKEPKR